MIRVLVADHHPVARAAVLGLLAAVDGMTAVGEAVDGEEAVDLAAQTRPDVVLLDVSMPRLSGLEAARLIAGQQPDVRILMFSAECRRTVVRAAREAGATGFLAKGCRATQILRAIRAVSRGRAVWPAGA